MKLKILLTLAGILFVSMLLMALVMIYLSHRFLIRSEISTAKKIAIMTAGLYASGDNDLNAEPDVKAAEKFITHMHFDTCIGVIILNRKLDAVFSSGNDPYTMGPLKAVATGVVKSGEMQESFYGTRWSVLCVQPEVYVVGCPVMDENTTIGAVGCAFKLVEAGKNMRKFQQIAILYLLINTALFAAIGFFRFDRFIVKPIQKLVKRATAYRAGDGPVFPYEGGGEWETLYRAVNRIVDLNTDDNRALKASVESLEFAMAELKKAQLEIIRAEKLATVGRLSSGIAHEIGNPIGIILGYIELLKDNSLSQDETSDILRRTGNEVRRIDRIIRQLLDFSRPVKKNRMVVSGHDAITEILEMMRAQPFFSLITVQLDLAAPTDRVTVDPGQLHQALLNLILNAADAIEAAGAERAGKLSISSQNVLAPIKTEKPKLVLKLSFSDNGEGISPDCLNNIFDPFYTTKPPGKGNGLGLWVSMMIIEGFGGKITVESRRGEGTTIHVFLPVEKNEMGEAQGER